MYGSAVLGLLPCLPSELALPLTVPRSSRVAGSPDGGWQYIKSLAAKAHEPVQRNAPVAALEPSLGLILLRTVVELTSSV